MGLSPEERQEIDLQARIGRPVTDGYQIGILALKGGVGRTAVTVALGSALSRVRGDRILAIDADPGGGDLADRAGKRSAATVTHLLANTRELRYSDVRMFMSINEDKLEVLASPDYLADSGEFDSRNWTEAVNAVSPYYNLVLADTGARLLVPPTSGVLSTVSGLVIIANASIDGARQAARTMEWLWRNGYHHLLGRTCVAINHVAPGKPRVDIADLVHQFERHVGLGRVVVLPWDKHIAAGTEIQFGLLGATFRRGILELGAALSDGFNRRRGD
jgi:MinD-like ATPase involved in chromosome partitioning or flagellar assembly